MRYLVSALAKAVFFNVENMRVLAVELYEESGESTARSLSLVIRLCDEAGVNEDSASLGLSKTKQRQRGESAPARVDVRHIRSCKAGTAPSRDRMLPSDRLVLNALLARVPQGKKVTRPVRLLEPMEECEISRSQARISLKRLNERGLVSRLLSGSCLGNQEGYSYKISPEVKKIK